VVKHYFQRIHPRGADVLLQRDVQEHEKEIRLVNIAGNAFNTITDDLIDREYEINVSAASAT